MKQHTQKTTQRGKRALADLKPAHPAKVTGGIDTVPLPERPRSVAIGTWPTPERPRFVAPSY